MLGKELIQVHVYTSREILYKGVVERINIAQGAASALLGLKTTPDCECPSGECP